MHLVGNIRMSAMLENLKHYEVILASNSPRRKELMEGLNIPFTVHTLPGVAETYPADCKGADIPLYIAREKAAAYRDMLRPNRLVITADTVVELDDCVLGKPVDADDAKRMLHLLAGRTHRVVTGGNVMTHGFDNAFTATTEVEFGLLTDEQIDYYVATYRPFDKAGSYGVQEWVGYVGVKSIRGSFYNVMGLPVHRLYQVLAQVPPLSK